MKINNISYFLFGNDCIKKLFHYFFLKTYFLRGVAQLVSLQHFTKVVLFFHVLDTKSLELVESFNTESKYRINNNIVN